MFPEIREAVVVGVLRSVGDVPRIESVVDFPVVQHPVTVEIQIIVVGHTINIEVAQLPVGGNSPGTAGNVDHLVIADTDVPGRRCGPCHATGSDVDGIKRRLT